MQIKRFEFNHFSENTYVVFDETKEAAIIDCGAFFNEEKTELENFIIENNLTITHHLNTHLHIDHALGTSYIYKKFGVKPEYNKQEEELLPRLQQQAEAFGLKMEDTQVPAGRYLEENDLIRIGNFNFKVLMVPGHSPASLCFYSEDNHCIFSGDVIFRGSIGRTDLWGGNYEQLISNIREKILTLPDDTAIYPGHGPVTTVKYERNSSPFFK